MLKTKRIWVGMVAAGLVVPALAAARTVRAKHVAVTAHPRVAQASLVKTTTPAISSAKPVVHHVAKPTVHHTTTVAHTTAVHHTAAKPTAHRTTTVAHTTKKTTSKSKKPAAKKPVTHQLVTHRRVTTAAKPARAV